MHNELSFNINLYSKFKEHTEIKGYGVRFDSFVLISLENFLLEFYFNDIDLYIDLKILHTIMSRHNNYIKATIDCPKIYDPEQIHNMLMKEFQEYEPTFNDTLNKISNHIDEAVPLIKTLEDEVELTLIKTEV